MVMAWNTSHSEGEADVGSTIDSVVGALAGDGPGSDLASHLFLWWSTAVRFLQRNLITGNTDFESQLSDIIPLKSIVFLINRPVFLKVVLNYDHMLNFFHKTFVEMFFVIWIYV